MLQPKKVNLEKTVVNPIPQTQVPQELVKPITFDDLVIDGALPAVKVRLRPAGSESSKKKKSPGLDDELLIELQCEV